MRVPAQTGTERLMNLAHVEIFPYLYGMRHIQKCGLCLIILFLFGFSSAKGEESNNQKQGFHTLSFGYSPVLWTEAYQMWKPIPPLKFSLNYTYDIPMRSRFVNFYAIGEVSYIGALAKLVFTVADPDDPLLAGVNSTKYKLNSVILSAGMGVKFHLVRFLDFAVFYTAGYRYTQGKTNIGGRHYANDDHLYSGCAGARFIGKIKKFNIYAGYSFAHLAPGDYLLKAGHYVDIGLGYTF